MNKLKLYLLSFLFLSIGIFLSPTKVRAALSNCQLKAVIPDPNNPQTFQVQFCIHADTRDDILDSLNNGKISAICNVNSMAHVSKLTGGNGFCKNRNLGDAITTVAFNGRMDDSWVEQRDGISGYYTCIGLPEINRDVGVMDIKVLDKNNTQVCNIQNVDVTPKDYDWFEGMKRVAESRVGNDTYNQGDPNSIRCADGGINTALGCINTTNIGGSIGQILGLAIGIGSGFSLLLMGYGVFIITSSAGIPDKINEGKSIITSAAGGLLFIILSVVLFKIIGVDILSLPGLQ